MALRKRIRTSKSGSHLHPEHDCKAGTGNDGDPSFKPGNCFRDWRYQLEQLPRDNREQDGAGQLNENSSDVELGLYCNDNA